MDEPTPNFYDILGVPSDADAVTIKAAYRPLARKYHPDYNKEPDAQEKFQAIQEAYDVLSDHRLRALYDARGPSFRREDREIRAAAEAMLTEQVVAWANEAAHDHNGADLLTDLGALFTRLEAEAAGKVLEGDAIAGRLARTLGKLKHKGGRDFLCIALAHRIENIRKQQDSMRCQQRVVELAHRLLKDYDFECVKQLSGLWTTVHTVYMGPRAI